MEHCNVDQYSYLLTSVSYFNVNKLAQLIMSNVFNFLYAPGMAGLLLIIMIMKESTSYT